MSAVVMTEPQSPSRSPLSPSSSSPLAADEAAAVFAEHRRYLWAVCYRLTGDTLDAEDLVQATFERALSRPPEDRARPWRPWLTRVASNLAIDLLRRRKHAAYDGPWLPAPVEDLIEVDGWTREHHGEWPALGSREHDDAERRYGQLESARFAFLLALETLDPRARAVLILRDVLGYTGPEVADALALTPANVRVILHRAHKQLDAALVDTPTPAPSGPAQAAAIARFMAALASGDLEALTQLLADDVRTTSDAAGEFLAARKIVTGRDRVVALFRGLANGAAPRWTQMRQLNGEPALITELEPGGRRIAPRLVMRVELDGDGRIAAVHLVLASRKLAGVRWPG